MSGPGGCTRCHTAFAGSPNFNCLDCHKEIEKRLRERRGLHTAYMGTSYSNAGCVRCHSEHNGEKFAIMKWDPSPERFDHSKTGFALDGKHSGMACAKCHSPERIAPDERAALRTTNLAHTFLGLSPTCTACHEDKHRGALGANCQRCHNAADWKARTFNHAKARFVLTGAHGRVSCQKCHTPTADGTPKWIGLRFERCASCHADVHRGAFPQSCESCHNTSAWKQTAVASRFDHAKTNYALVGKHLDVRCETCHHGADFKRALAHDTCAACHTPDPHHGQFAKRADGGRCDACHTLDGFKPAKFAVAQHDMTAFPLHGKHAAIACAKCHTPVGKATLFKGVKFASCTDCHQDVHRNQFARAPYFNRCQECHNESEFHPSTFSLARHQQSRFVLVDGHVATACGDCHKPEASLKTAIYHWQTISCTTCHADPHRRQFRAVRQGSAANNCESCHVTKTWKDLSRFDHNTTRFLLTGAHRSVQCVACHIPPNLERKLINVNFSAAASQCEACHEDVHGGQFMRGATERCGECHSTTKWRPSLFNHETTVFSLKGAHQEVRCAACHVAVRKVKGRDVLFYKPTPTVCAACHANAIAGKVPA